MRNDTFQSYTIQNVAANFSLPFWVYPYTIITAASSSILLFIKTISLLYQLINAQKYSADYYLSPPS